MSALDMAARRVCLPFVAFWISCAGFQAAYSAEPGDSPWRISMSTNKAEYLVREPVLVAFERQNTSDRVQTLFPVRPYALMVEKEGHEQSRYILFQTGAEQKGKREKPRVKVAPNAKEARSFWIVLAVPDGSARWIWDFLFPTAGTWTLVLPEDPRATVSFEVVEPVTEQDRKAADLFTPLAVGFFLGDPPVRECIPNLTRICTECPGSRYAPYAAIALARRLARRRYSKDRDITRDLSEYKNYLDLIIDKRKDSAFHDEALQLLAGGYIRRGEKQDAAEVVARLAKEHPGSPYMAKIRQDYRIRPGQLPPEPKPVVPEGSVVGKFIGKGLDRIPEGPRRVFEAYHSAIVARRYDDAVALLAPDFWGGFGDRAATDKGWNEGTPHSYVVSLTFNVEQSSTESSFTLVRERPQRVEKSWSGEICVVVGSTVLESVNAWSGTRSTVYGSSATLALRKSAGKWQVIAERIETRNQKVYPFANELIFRLRSTRSLKGVTVWDGKSEVALDDEVRSRLPEAARQVELVWEITGMSMTGKERDIPEVRGNVTARLPQADGEPVEVRYEVTMTFVLDGDRLRLTDLDVIGPDKDETAARPEPDTGGQAEAESSESDEAPDDATRRPVESDRGTGTQVSSERTPDDVQPDSGNTGVWRLLGMAAGGMALVAGVGLWLAYRAKRARGGPAAGVREKRGGSRP